MRSGLLGATLDADNLTKCGLPSNSVLGHRDLVSAEGCDQEDLGHTLHEDRGKRLGILHVFHRDLNACFLEALGSRFIAA